MPDDITLEKPQDDQVEKNPKDHVVLRSSADEVGPWRALSKYKRVVALMMLAAFSASLDGYQINLNGSIVANKGFIALMAPVGSTVIEAKWVSAWGGIQSAGQCIGQMFIAIVSERLGRRVALGAFWIMMIISVAIESSAKHPVDWLIAKLFAGIGVGAMQGTLPMYISEHSPTQIRGLLINAYSFWFVVGQLLAPTALLRLNVTHPYDWRVAVYTQWGMIGLMGIIFVFLPESPWWLVSKGKLDAAEKIMNRYRGHIEGFNVKQEVEIMAATVDEERQQAVERGRIGHLAVFKGTNLKRFIIALWPKFMQGFVGLTLFNTYATYFFQLAGNTNPFRVTVILACVQLISVLCVCALTDTVGRRPLTVYPYMVTTLSMWAFGAIGTQNYKSKALGSLLIFFGCLATFTTTAASAIGYAYLAEIPTQDLRARSNAWGQVVVNAFGVMLNFTVPIMLKGAPNWGVKTGFFFGCTGTIVCTIGWFILPEVARRTPAEIDEMFEAGISPRQFAKYETEIERELKVQEGHQV